MIEAGMGVGTNKHEINDKVVTEVDGGGVCHD